MRLADGPCEDYRSFWVVTAHPDLGGQKRVFLSDIVVDPCAIPINHKMR